MSNLLVAADMLEDMGNPLCETLREYADKPMKCGHDAFELQREVSEATGINVSKDLLYVAYMFNEFGGIERKLVTDCGRREYRFPASRDTQWMLGRPVQIEVYESRFLLLSYRSGLNKRFGAWVIDTSHQRGVARMEDAWFGRNTE